MKTNQFTLRRYKEEDADILYAQYESYTWSNIQPYFSAGIGMDRDKFLKAFQKHSKSVYRPPIIAGVEDDIPFGVVNVSYRHANHYFEIMIHIWDRHHLTKDVLEQIFNQILYAERADSLLLEIPGYELELKKAADELGLDLVGTIPNYLRHDDALFDKLFYVTNAIQWQSRGSL